VRHEAQVSEVDPFELPDWLGTGDVTWTAGASVRQAHRVDGELSAGSQVLACDLIAADQAYPQPVLDEKWRQQAHRAWTHGQVLLIEYDGRLTLATPGTSFTADGVLETLARLARALGVPPERFVAAVRL
jgi:hypothetical protein